MSPRTTSTVSRRQVARFRRFLAAYVDRYREAAEPEQMCCPRCGVVVNNEKFCWNCQWVAGDVGC